MKFGLFILVFILSFHAKASDDTKVNVAITNIEGLLDEQSSGAYDVVLERILKGQNNVSVMRGPILRIRRLFYGRKADCLFVGINHPEYYHYRNLPFDEVLISASLKTIRLRLYTLPGAETISDIEDLRGKAVAYASGVSSLEEFSRVFASRDIETLRVEKNLQAFQMLEFGRVAAVAAYGLDIKELSRHLPDVAKYQHDPDFFASESEDVMACWRSPKTEAFVKHFNQKVALLKETGELHEILNR